MLLTEYLKAVTEEEELDSLQSTEAKATAICRFAEQELGVSDVDVLDDLYDQLLTIL